MSANFVDRHQVKIFMAVAFLVLGACAVSVWLRGTQPINWEVMKGAATSIGIAACGIAAGIVVCLLLFSHDYEWWGNAQGTVGFIGIGAILSLIGSVFDLINLLRPFF